MKKRKELNALIGLSGDGKKKKSKKSSGHQLLLRTEATATASDSESTSEFDEFAQPASSSLFAKGGYIRCCKICYPLCAFVMLAACVVACVGLVWMQVALKEDLDALKEKFRTLESSQKTSFSDIPKLNEDLLAVQKDLTKIDTGDRGISKIWTNITELNKQISQLNSAVAHLKANVKSASDLINLPVTLEELQKSVATIGSTLTSVQHDVDTVRTTLENQKKIVETLQQNKDILDLHDEVDKVNATQTFYHTHNDEKLHHIDLAVNNLSQRVILLENNLLTASNATKIESVNDSVVALVNNSQEVVSSDQPVAFKAQKSSGLNQNDSSQMSNLRERLKVMVNALTSKPDNLGNANAIINQGNTSLTSTVKPSVSSTLPVKAVAKKNNKRNVKLKHLSFPGITNIKGLQDLFLNSNDGQLSYQDLYNLFGIQTPKPEELQQFDLNEDGRFSQTELINAFGP
ncbi:EF-hand calcium-binding domain-containing protein 14 isoform X1 [Carcharodon carcharias]|uniref:EF-hand calcium-binding domain-containing protein 14 isoform X1 n=1 Tax=Carcharodon carcharias TaxID=13397 RepID=UPI001B7DB351|nr:EF-hand calcium-binding domain-containing protein 14 isoform X1 [Carcharodon carcharias]